MHPSVMEWVEQTTVGLGEGSTLEVGSRNVNGTVRGFFSGPYIGLDQISGIGVDVVRSSRGMPFVDECFDTVISTEMLEHDAWPEQTFREMHRVLKPGGHLILTTRGPGFPKHEFPGDYHRFTPEDISAWFSWLGLVELECKPDTDVKSPGVFAHATKPAWSTVSTQDAPAVRGLD